MSTQKTREFIGTPLVKTNDNLDVVPIEAIGGINNSAANALKHLGFKHAYNLVGKFLMLDMDEEIFTQWLKDTLDAEGIHLQDRHLHEVYSSLNGWVQNNM